MRGPERRLEGDPEEHGAVCALGTAEADREGKEFYEFIVASGVLVVYSQGEKTQ